MIKRGKKINYASIVKNRKLPILTLDARWHELFPEDGKTSVLKELEQKVNSLLKQQGKLVNDIKDMKSLKTSLMKDIVNNMEISNDVLGKAKDKKLGKNKKYIHELNDKLEHSMDDLADLPYQIKDANEQLMAESLKICYERMHHNMEDIKEITNWIAKVRSELKDKILLKQDMELRNATIYSYMHDILGAELMEVFDIAEQNKPMI